MPKRTLPALRIACFILAALVLYEFSRFFLKRDSLADLELNVDTVASAAVAPVPSVKSKETNAPPKRGGPARPNDLPPAIQARVDRITQSEILGMVMRPLPMALLGIAGDDAIIRTPMGQTSLMKVGDEAGGIKLLRIGINRVLIEQENQTKELTLFSGFGSESLLPKGEKVEPKPK
jgi:hypothetical protein